MTSEKSRKKITAPWQYNKQKMILSVKKGAEDQKKIVSTKGRNAFSLPRVQESTNEAACILINYVCINDSIYN